MVKVPEVLRMFNLQQMRLGEVTGAVRRKPPI